MFKNFCRCNAAVSDLYDGKSKNKIAIIFFPNSHGWRDDLSYIEKYFFPEETENIFFEILLQNTKPITVEIIFGPPNQKNFLQNMNDNFAKIDTFKKELYILGDFGIKLYHNENLCRMRKQYFFVEGGFYKILFLI